MTQLAANPSGSRQPLGVFLVGDDPRLAAAILKQEGLHLAGQVPTVSLMLPLIRDCPADVLLVTARALEGWPAEQAISGFLTLNPRLQIALAGGEEMGLLRYGRVDWLFPLPYHPAQVARAISSKTRVHSSNAWALTSEARDDAAEGGLNGPEAGAPPEALPGRLLRMFAPSPGKGSDPAPAAPDAEPAEWEEPARLPSPSRTIAVCGPKGGVGKTTLATNLAVSLAQAQPGSTLLIDLSLRSAEVGLHLDLLDGPTLVDALPYVAEANAATLAPYLQEHRPSGLRVLLGPPRAELAELVRTESALSLLRTLQGGYRFAVLDLGGGCGEEVTAFAAAADEIWLVTTLEPAALRQTQQALEALNRFREGLNKRVRVVANRVGIGSAVPRYQAERFLGVSLAGEVPEDDAGAARALQQGIPAVMEGGPLALGIEALARHLGVNPGKRSPSLPRWLRMGRR